MALPWIKSSFYKKNYKEEDSVRLPAIFGIHPGYYLAVLYGAAILFLLFLIFVFPGISKPGSIGVFSSEPYGAAVRVDNVTLGYTPCEIFLPRGSITIEFILPGFYPDKHELEVPGRLFGSLFFPRKITIAGTLTSPDPVNALALSALDYMYWSATGEPIEAYQIPMSLSEGVYRTGPAARNPALRTVMQDILNHAFLHTTNKVSARDLIRSQFLLDNNGLSPSPLSILSTLQESLRISNIPSVPFWLEDMLSVESSARLIRSDWYSRHINTVEESQTVNIDIPLQFPGELLLETVHFIAVRPGYLEKSGRREIVAPILVASDLISQAAWERFIAENPEWSIENKESLINRGLVGEDYLVPAEFPAYPVPAVSGISWYAAAAFCSWLTAKLPPSLSGWELRLPSEIEWEYAARQQRINNGLLWEWCSDPYAPLDFFTTTDAAAAALEKAAGWGIGAAPALERVVRGGSWINHLGIDYSESSGIEIRGALPPGNSSPFVGFRPVIVPSSEAVPNNNP